MRWVVRGSQPQNRIDVHSLVSVEYLPDNELDSQALLMIHKSIKAGHAIDLIDPDMQDDSGALIARRVQWEPCYEENTKWVTLKQPSKLNTLAWFLVYTLLILWVGSWFGE